MTSAVHEHHQAGHRRVKGRSQALKTGENQMSALIITDDIVAVEYVKKFRADLWTKHLMAFESQRPLTHEERVRDSRAAKDIHHHRHWPIEVIEAFGNDWRKL
jgi:hypothetical protein